jgi:hypothetical protein
LARKSVYDKGSPSVYRIRPLGATPHGPATAAALDQVVSDVVRSCGADGLDRLESAISRHRVANRVRMPVRRAVDRVMGAEEDAGEGEEASDG